MPFPADLPTYQLRFGPVTGYDDTQPISCTVSVTANMSVIWNPTGLTIAEYPITKKFSGTGSVLFTLADDSDVRIVDGYGVPVRGRLKYLVEWRFLDANGYVLETGVKWASKVPNMADPYQVLLT